MIYFYYTKKHDSPPNKHLGSWKKMTPPDHNMRNDHVVELC